MNAKLLTLGTLIVALGYILTTFSSTSLVSTSFNQSISYEIRKNYTYIVEETFLLQNKLERELNDTVYISVPMNTTNQFSIILSSSPAYDYIYNDIDGSPILVYKVTLKPNESIWINISSKVIVERYKLSFGEEIPWYSKEEVEKLTGEKHFWPVGNETYVSIANQLSKNIKSPVEASKEIAKWIIDHLNYIVVPRIGAERAILYRNGKYIVYGDCEEVADVFVTLARTLGIPSRVVHGILLMEHDEQMYAKIENGRLVLSSNWGGHAWPQIYVRNFGWIDVEMLEGLVPKVGDLSEMHIKFNIEEKKYYGSTIDSFCISSYLELSYMGISTRLIGG